MGFPPVHPTGVNRQNVGTCSLDGADYPQSICATILYTAREKTDFLGYMKGYARAYKVPRRQQNENDQIQERSTQHDNCKGKSKLTENHQVIVIQGGTLSNRGLGGRLLFCINGVRNNGSEWWDGSWDFQKLATATASASMMRYIGPWCLRASDRRLGAAGVGVGASIRV